jgi:hypothetical protein
MDFKTNGKVLRIRFLYESVNRDGVIEYGGRALTSLEGKRIFTYCEVSIKDDAEGSEFVGIAGDCAIRHPNDKFNKGLGRRTALSRTLWQIKDRELRAAIWKSYLKNHNDRINTYEPAKQEA